MTYTEAFVFIKSFQIALSVSNLLLLLPLLFLQSKVFNRALLSTTLLNGLVSALPPGIWLSLYVGDLTIHASGLSLPALRQLLQIAMALISYVIDHSFRSSTSKSFSIHFFFSCLASQSPLSISPNPISPFRQVPRCHLSSNCSGGTISILLKKLLAVSSGSCRLSLISSRIYTTNNSSASILP